MAEQFCLKWNNHQSTIISNFDTLLETQKHVDCSLAADGKVLRAHKVVLSACSPYLEQLLNHEKDKYPVLVFSDVKFEYLKAMLDYMYRGEVNVLQEHLNGFLKAAETLQIKGLTDQGGGGGGSSGGEMKRKQPLRMNETAQPASPPQERSMSPTVPAKRRRQRRPSQDQLSDSHLDTSNSCDIPTVPPPAAVTKPQVETDRISNATAAPSAVQPKLEPVEASVVQPKTEFIDDTNDEQIEDLTLDDDDDDGYMAKPGSSHGNDSQGFDTSWQFGGETSNPDMFLGTQDPTGNQNNSQDKLEDLSDAGSDEKITVIVVPEGYSMTEEEEVYHGVDESVKKEPLDCPKCDTKFTEEAALRRHVKRHSKDTSNFPYKCNGCDSAFKLERTLEVHKTWECGKEPRFQCRLCDKKFHLEQYLRQHLTKHNKRPKKIEILEHICSQCGRGFRHKSNLDNHLKFECGKEPGFECEVCGERFHFKAHLNEHKLMSHTEATMEGAGSDPTDSLEVSELGGVKYYCKLCPRAFTRVGSLNYHVSRKHSGKALETSRDPVIYPYLCSQCGNRYRNSTQLCRHRKWECGKEPMFQCTQCIKKFHHRHGLKQHIRLHISKKNKQNPSMEFYCDKCGKGYKLKSSLNNHTKWECGKEPVFACTICFVKFSHKGNLKKHILTKHINMMDQSLL